nr:hypothetical protein [Tanacetum cinerariifolium]
MFCDHFQRTQVIVNDLCKEISGNGLLGPHGESYGGKGGRGGSMTGRGDGWLAKRLIVSNEGHGGGGLVVREGKSSSALKNWCGDIGGVEKINSTGSQSIANEEDCLDGCDGAGREHVNGEGVNLGVFKSLLDEIPGNLMGESGGDTLGLDG